MKVGLCSVPPAGHSTSLLCLLNSSSMISLFENIIKQFTRLYKRKVKIWFLNVYTAWTLENKEKFISLYNEFLRFHQNFYLSILK